MRAFIFVETRIGTSKAVTAALRQVDGVQSVDTVTGPYDIIATLEGPDLPHIADLVAAKIQAVPGVLHTTTTVAMAA